MSFKVKNRCDDCGAAWGCDEHAEVTAKINRLEAENERLREALLSVDCMSDGERGCAVLPRERFCVRCDALSGDQ